MASRPGWRRLEEQSSENEIIGKVVVEDDSIRILLADHRAAIQQILASCCEHALENIMQETVNLQAKSVDQNFDKCASGQKVQMALVPQVIGQPSATMHSPETREAASAKAKPIASPQRQGSTVGAKDRRQSSEPQSQQILPQEANPGSDAVPDSPGKAKMAAEESTTDGDELVAMTAGNIARTRVSAAVGRKSQRKTAKSKIRASMLGDFSEQSTEGRMFRAVEQQQGVFADAEAIKQKMRREIARPAYNVTEMYKKDGYCQALATSSFFENLTLIVIAFNAIWISVDIDCNHAALLNDADPVFIVMDNLFCFFFTFELATRFGAFAKKKNTVRDAWFVFDAFMCALMVLETWALPMVVVMFSARGGAGLGDASLLKGFRLVRLVRMARVIRLLNALPELMIVIKGMAVATRAVGCTCALMLLIIYVFAVIFRQLTDGTSLGRTHFHTVLATMRFLLLHGTMPDVSEVALDIWSSGDFYAVMFLGFILVVTITIMNMLVGVLVGVVNTVASVEKEQLTVNFVKENLLNVLRRLKDTHQVNLQQQISREEFGKLLQLPEAIRAFNMMNVDVFGLVDLADFIFQDGKPLPFSEFMELTMQLRGSNQATVKDIVDLRKFMVMEFNHHLTGLKQTSDTCDAASTVERPVFIRTITKHMDATTSEQAMEEIAACDDENGQGDPDPKTGLRKKFKKKKGPLPG